MSFDRCQHLNNQHPNQNIEYFHYSRNSSCPFLVIPQHLPASTSQETTDLISIPIDYFSLF